MFRTRAILRFGFRTISRGTVGNLTKNYSTDVHSMSMRLPAFSFEEITVKTVQMTLVNVELTRRKENDKDSLLNFISVYFMVPITHDGCKLTAKYSSEMLELSAPKIEGDLEKLFKDVPIEK